MYDLMTSVMVLVFMIIWGIVKWRTPIHAPKMTILYGFMICTITNLSIRNYLPSWMTSADGGADNDNIFTTVVICHCMNYNTMLTTFFIQCPMFLI